MTSNKTFRNQVALIISGSGVTSPRSLKKADEIIDLIKSDVIGDGEVHVSHVCPQDSIPCREFQARCALRNEQRAILRGKAE